MRISSPQESCGALQRIQGADRPSAAHNAAPARRGRPSRAARARHSRRQLKLQVSAVVAPPEKPVGTDLPPFEAWNTGAPVKKRTDLKTIMLLGAGPIVIGQVHTGAQIRSTNHCCQI